MKSCINIFVSLDILPLPFYLRVSMLPRVPCWTFAQGLWEATASGKRVQDSEGGIRCLEKPFEEPRMDPTGTRFIWVAWTTGLILGSDRARYPAWEAGQVRGWGAAAAMLQMHPLFQAERGKEPLSRSPRAGLQARSQLHCRAKPASIILVLLRQAPGWGVLGGPCPQSMCQSAVIQLARCHQSCCG